MLVSRYSKPEFDPYEGGESVPEPDSGPWRAPTAAAPLNAVVPLPGSKSLTNRELVLSALAAGPSLLRAPLLSRDTLLMIEALRGLGTEVELVGDDLRITPGELTGGTSIDCGLAGTVMRFVPVVAALALGPVAFDGDPAARSRPMRPLLDALRALGVEINDDGRGALPFSMYGTGSLAGGEVEVDASASSQFVSALLLAAPRFDDGLTVRHRGERLPSVPHIEMTLQVLRDRGVDASSPEAGLWRVEPGAIAGAEVRLEPDLSNAAPFLAAALIAGGTVTVSDWPAETTQVGDLLRELLPLYGATVAQDAQGVTVDGGTGALGGGRLRAVDLDLTAAGELAPTLVTLAAFADGTSRILGIGHLRGHETDRLAALAAELTAHGCSITELPDGLEVIPGELRGGPWNSYDDHRMATSGALLGLGVDGVEVENVGTTDKTLPRFVERWEQLLHPVIESGPDPWSSLLL